MADMRVIDAGRSDAVAELRALRRSLLLDRLVLEVPPEAQIVQDIITDVCRRGDQAVAEITARVDGAQVPPDAVRVPPEHIAPGMFTYRSGLEASEKLLAHANPPTAICAANDDMAAAAVSVAHRRGMEVPRDLSIVGFDDTSAATTVWPELTTIRQPIAAMADSAIDILLRNVRRKDKSTRTVVDHLVPHELVERDSVAPPAR